MLDTLLKHIEHFTNTIGPRGSTTPEEKKAHEYCKQTLEGLGYEAHWEEYYAPTSGWHPFALAFGLILLADLLFWLSGRTANAQLGGLAASAIAVITVISFFMQITYRDNPLRWFLPVAKSQNVWASARPGGEVKRRLVITGHVDTHRTALAMQSLRLWEIFQILTLVAGIANLVLVGLFVYGIFTSDALIRQIALWVGIIPVIGLVFTLQPDFTPYVKGANDNASGAAAVLALAERLKQEALQNTEVFLVNTGCEEVGCFGVVDWIRRHSASEAPEARYLVVDNIGGKGSALNYVVEEIVLTPVKADGSLVALAGSTAKENSELDAKPFRYRGLYTEMSLCTVNGQKAIALANFDPRTRTPPNFHTVRDDMSNIDPALLERSLKYAWAFLQKFDA
jgi:hypothetical protein